jgi:hypothetical protein
MIKKVNKNVKENVIKFMMIMLRYYMTNIKIIKTNVKFNSLKVDKVDVGERTKNVERKNIINPIYNKKDIKLMEKSIERKISYSVVSQYFVTARTKKIYLN